MPELPPDLAAHLARLAALPPADPVALRAQVEAHLAAAEAAAAASSFVDVALARRLAASCLALLDTPLPAPKQALAQAACRYFADPDDDEDDFASVIGFEDDAELLNHVVHALHLDELHVELS